jgi:hypothetical protein
MASVHPFLNLGLALLGIFLLVILGKESVRSEKLTRYLFAGYYLIVLQYNHERILTFPNFLLLVVAGIVLFVWTYTSVERKEAL